MFTHTHAYDVYVNFPPSFSSVVALHGYLLCPLEMAPVIFLEFLVCGHNNIVPGSVSTLLATDLKSAVSLGSLNSFQWKMVFRAPVWML